MSENYYIVSDTSQKVVADAIREAGGTSALLSYPQGWADAIGLLSASSGVGTITQDNNGYLILDNVAGNTGLKYELGTFTPAQDTTSYNVSFSKTYSSLPFMTVVMLASGTYDDTLNSILNTIYFNFESIFGVPFYVSTTSIYYGFMRYQYRGTNATSTGSGNSYITYPLSSTSTNSSGYPRFHVTQSGMTTSAGGSTYYFRTGKTYKWIAVWPPQSLT